MKTKSPTRPEEHGADAANGSTEAFTGGWLHGTIVTIHPGRDLLVLCAQETKRTLVIRWVPETRFAFEGRPSSSKELRFGQQARVHCRLTNHELEADNISLARAADYPPEHWVLPALACEGPTSIYERLRTYHPDR